MPFVELQSVDSTNNYALAQIHANLAQPGTCYFAHEQIAGKGQRGKTWATEKQANITLSIVLKPIFLQPFQQFQLSACVAIATRHFLNKYASEAIRIKWPNDLYWQDKKLGGILIENIIGSQGTKVQNGQNTVNTWQWAVIGIGLNINQTKFPADLKNPVSLKQITNQQFDTLHLAKELCYSVDHFYKKLMTEGPTSILDPFNAVLYKKNEIVKFKKDNRIFKAAVKYVNELGQLTVQHAIEEQFNFGEVEWLL
ncbi:MAG TPA: biotin--[acetyl-CoA-carboxylase] ligase [Chitinophagaceae bacterium]|jgi:BirA family biotin operon repressor/biotin-[acetyl-CoA-carboxylase] ligase|nr:biotin--[acetyl-CoA-carboxylase] ligase [Chitinophagaceae bacterium]